MNEVYERRVTKLRYRQYYVIKSKKKNRLQELDILIEKSNIRHKIQYVTAEVVMILSIMVYVIVFLLMYSLLYNILVAIVTGIFFYQIPRILLKILATRNAEKVDENLVYYVDLLTNYCGIFDNIVVAIEKSIPEVKEPLRTYSLAFVSEVKHGIPIFDALENFKGKVTNKRFKLLMKNLQLCVKFKGSYSIVLKKSNTTLNKFATERDSRKSEVRKHRATIYAMIVIVVSIIYLVFYMFPMMYFKIKTDIVIQLIIAINILVILYALFRSLTLEKFEF